MSFDIQEFKMEALSEAGVMRPNYFVVNIYLPPALRKHLGHSDMSESIPFLCEATSLPGVNLLLQEGLQRYGYGPIEKKPQMAVFSNHDMLFIGDGAGRIYEFFQKWILFIANYSSSGSGEGLKTSNQSGAKPYEVRYRDDYEATIEIIVFDTTGQKVLRNTLGHAFPIAMAPIQLSWAATDQYVRIPVLFTYRDWSSERSDLQSLGLGGILGGQLLNILSNPQALNTNTIRGVANGLGARLGGGLTRSLGLPNVTPGLISGTLF